MMSARGTANPGTAPTSRTAQTLERSQPERERPVFLVGSMRSGTTVATLMLRAHPQLSWLVSFEFAVEQVRARHEWPTVDEFVASLRTHRIFNSTGLNANPVLDYPAMLNDFLRQQRERDGKPIIGATVHLHFDRLHWFWPDAKFIHLLRDGRDVARSCMVMGWAGNVYKGVETWVEAERLWEALRQQLSPSQFIEIRNEDLIRTPRQTLTRICRFIGVEFDPRMLEYPRHTSYGPPDPNLTEQWRRKMSADDVRLLETKVGKMLTARGYALSGLPPRPASRALQLWLLVQHRWGRMRFRRRRYGWRLWLAAILASRLGSRAWQDRVRVRLDAIDTKHLK